MASNGVGMALLWLSYGGGMGRCVYMTYCFISILFEFIVNLFQDKSHTIRRRHFTLKSLLEYGL